MIHIRGFNGIRALAATTVVLTHLQFFTVIVKNDWLSRGVIQSIDGSSGVQAFFVLSGFLITTLLIAEKKTTSSISLYNFYIRRSLRIFPLYFLVLFLVLVLHLTGEHVTNSVSLAFAALYVHNFIPIAWYSEVLGHTWSLAVEEHFYLLWPIVFVSFSRNFRILFFLTFSFFLLSLLVLIWLTRLEWLNQHFYIDGWTFVAGSSIALGGLLALMLGDEKLGNKTQQMLQLKLTLLFAGILIFSQALIVGLDPLISKYIRGVGFALLVGWVAMNQNSLLVRALELKPLEYLGKVSYGIYMYQGFFLATGPYRVDGQTWPPDQATGFILLVITVPLSYHYFEKPIMKLRYKYQRSVRQIH